MGTVNVIEGVVPCNSTTGGDVDDGVLNGVGVSFVNIHTGLAKTIMHANITKATKPTRTGFQLGSIISGGASLIALIIVPPVNVTRLMPNPAKEPVENTCYRKFQCRIKKYTFQLLFYISRYEPFEKIPVVLYEFAV